MKKMLKMRCILEVDSEQLQKNIYNRKDAENLKIFSIFISIEAT